MTKKEIVKEISEKLGMTQLKTKEIVQHTFDAIVDTLLSEERIELRNFGVFEVKRRKARKARNPRTGERVNVEPKFVVTFKPGSNSDINQVNVQNKLSQATPMLPQSVLTTIVMLVLVLARTVPSGQVTTPKATTQPAESET